LRQLNLKENDQTLERKFDLQIIFV
jgi:hypothetical protein